VKSARRFPCRAESVAAARKFAREVLHDQSGETIGAAELMISELASNCVRHAHSDFELVIDYEKCIRVEVRDSGHGQPVLQNPTPRDISGRGLRIIETMSEDWGVIPSANGKTVWFEMNGVLSETPAVASSTERPDREAPTPRPSQRRGANLSSRRTRRTPNGSLHLLTH
jgi:anti-sigma regulatory factor (Ser/Thr protein kinase)